MRSEMKRYDVYDGVDLTAFPDKQWMLSLEVDWKVPVVSMINGEQQDLFADPIVCWDSFDAMPELLKSKITVLFILNVRQDDDYDELADYMWAKGGYTVRLSDDELDSITEELNCEN